MHNLLARLVGAGQFAQRFLNLPYALWTSSTLNSDAATSTTPSG